MLTIEFSSIKSGPFKIEPASIVTFLPKIIGPFEVEDGSILVSINLSPHSRGKGYGSKMLLLSEEILDFGSKEKEDYYRAEIYKDNIASIKIFEKAGYVLKSSKDNILLYTKLIK